MRRLLFDKCANILRCFWLVCSALYVKYSSSGFYAFNWIQCFEVTLKFPIYSFEAFVTTPKQWWHWMTTKLRALQNKPGEKTNKQPSPLIYLTVSQLTLFWHQFTAGAHFPIIHWNLVYVNLRFLCFAKKRLENDTVSCLINAVITAEKIWWHNSFHDFHVGISGLTTNLSLLWQQL